MDKNKIIIEGAREHNLKNISVEIPRNSLTIITGLSGSGKSTLAFDTLYAEGQRRYVESLSTYARQFLGQMDKPDVDAIIGLSPAISIEQKTASHNPRSTVGTVTEIYDYLRLLFARVGIPYCYKCGLPISSMSIDQITDQVMDLDKKSKIMILAPLITGQKGSHEKLFAKLKKDGFARIRVDNKIYLMDDVAPLEKNKKHTIDAVVDRLVIKNGIEIPYHELEITASRSGGPGGQHVNKSDTKITVRWNIKETTSLTARESREPTGTHLIFSSIISCTFNFLSLSSVWLISESSDF